MQSAQAEFDDTKSQLKSARADLSAAQKALAPLQSRVDDAEANVRAIESKFDGSLASASDVQAARSARDAAQSTLKSRDDKARKRAKANPDLRNQTRHPRARPGRGQTRQPRRQRRRARRRKRNPRRPLRHRAPAMRTRCRLKRRRSWCKTRSPKAAPPTREADRLRALVDAYQTQAQKSNQRITNATENLQEAQRKSQQQMVQTVPRVRFTAGRAPADGTVVWIATLAREVGAGPVGVWPVERPEVSGALRRPAPAAGKTPASAKSWARLWRRPRRSRPATPAVKAPSADDAGSPPMPVLVAPAPNANANAAPNADAAPVVAPTPELDASNAVQQGAKPVKVRLTRIAPPERATDAAIIEGELVSDAAAAGRITACWRRCPTATRPKF